MIILGIETTCDETGAAVVEDGRRILSNVVASSATLHKKYKGVVPEVAAREQVRVIIPIIEEALRQAQCELAEIDAISVAYGPGLIGSLLVGVETAKALALVWNKPLVPVNHLIGHVYANWLTLVVNRKSLIVNGENSSIYHSQFTINFPLVALIVSGGHTDLILMKDHGKYKWLGGTRDDAAGEAFDKVARVLGLGYPGGPEIERVASKWKRVNGKSKIVLPRPMMHDFPARGGPAFGWDFSFSGLKTAVVNLVHSDEFVVHSREEIAHEFQETIVDVLVTKTVRAAKKYAARSIVVGGGVAANSELRYRMSDAGKKNKIAVFFPSKDLSVDNGAMIAAAAFYNFKPKPAVKVQADPGLYFSL